MAEAAVRHVDDVGADRLERLVVEAPAVEDARREVLGHDIGDADELPEQLTGAFDAQVERDAQLLDVVVVVGAPEVDAAALVDLRRVAAKDVPAPLRYRILDTDDLRPEGCKEPGCPGAGQLPGEVADTEMGECAVRHDGRDTGFAGHL